MQLERGKTSTSLLGSFRSIIREEGFVQCYRLLLPKQSADLFRSYSFGRLYRGRRRSSPKYSMTRLNLPSKGLVPPLLLEAPKRATKLCVSFTSSSGARSLT